jgi:hypothetical protein
LTALGHDERRRRSLFFDGRFLTARDLTREQTYFLTRQADLGRAGGVGVVEGLMVEAYPSGDRPSTTLTIAAGHGVTPSGELVAVPEDLRVEVANLADIERLDAAFGLSPIPREAARNRTGLYVVALRPVEYTANPVATYPTTLGGARTIEDADIIEAVAVTLVPYPDQTGRGDLDERRARVAHEIFVRGVVRGVPVDALPIAMIALDHGVVQWVDPFLVRREVGFEESGLSGFGQAPRALRQAYLLQYDQHLASIEARLSRGFAAGEELRALPPAGRVPRASVDGEQSKQIYFPAAIDVHFAIVPEDELGVLLDESLLLPPIDLTLTEADLASTSVLVLAPLPRARIAASPPPSMADAIANASALWYVRRRNVPSAADVLGVVSVPGAGATGASGGGSGGVFDADELNRLRDRLAELGLDAEAKSLDDFAFHRAFGDAVDMLSKLVKSPILLAGALGELFAPGGVQAVAKRYKDVGSGVEKLLRASPELATPAVYAALGASGVVPEIDRLLLDSTRNKDFAEGLSAVLKRVPKTDPATGGRLIAAYVLPLVVGSPK